VASCTHQSVHILSLLCREGILPYTPPYGLLNSQVSCSWMSFPTTLASYSSDFFFT
jgi:hypothetical protein